MLGNLTRPPACVKIGSPQMPLAGNDLHRSCSVTHILPKVFLFDMDDTILNYDSVADPSWRQVCETVAPRTAGLEAGELFTALKTKSQWFWSDPDRHLRGRLNMLVTRMEIVSLALSDLDVSDPGLTEEIALSYERIRTESITPRPGAIETLRRLHDDGFKLGMITNGSSEPQREKIDRFGLEPLFDSIVIEGEFGVGKPNRSVFQHSLDVLGTSAQEACMTGDNLYFDVGGAQHLGIWGIWVDWRDAGLPADSTVNPDRTVRFISELIEPV